MHFGKEHREGKYVIIDLEPDDDDFVYDIPEGCKACGGDYPNCADSCPIFDD